jgi:hypothetical protein
MIYFWLSSHILFSIVTIVTANVGLRTQQGIIYGRATQDSTEYLGYDDITQLNDFVCDCFLEFNMQK